VDEIASGVEYQGPRAMIDSHTGGGRRGEASWQERLGDAADFLDFLGHDET
jgi:hypothetical protein